MFLFLYNLLAIHLIVLRNYVNNLIVSHLHVHVTREKIKFYHSTFNFFVYRCHGNVDYLQLYQTLIYNVQLQV